MADRIIIIEIGERLTKVCETDYKGQGDIYNFFAFDTPVGTLVNNRVKESNEFRFVLEEKLHEYKIKTKRVVFAISSVGIGTKEEVVPAMRENRLKEYVKTNMTSFFPVDPEEHQVVYRINGASGDGKNRLQLYAVNNGMVKSYQDLAKFCGLALVDIEFVENGIAQGMRRDLSKGLVANISVEESYTSITVVKDGDVMIQRNITYGLSDAVTALQESNLLGVDLSFMQVIDKMKESACVYHSFAEMADDEQEDPIKQTVTENLRYVAGNISRILEYYLSQSHEETYDKVILSGLGCCCRGLIEFLQSETGYDLTNANNALEGGKTKHIDREMIGMAVSVLCASIAPIGISISGDTKTGMAGILGDTKNLKTAKRLFFLCVGLSVLLTALSLGNNIKLRLEEKELEDSIQSMQEAKKVNDEFLAVKGQYDELLAMCEMTDTPNDALLNLFKEMEDAIPTEATISEMTADANQVAISFETPTKQAAAKTISAFRKFESVKDVTTPELKRESVEETGVTYTFTINCVYSTAENEEEADSENAQTTDDEQTTNDEQAADQEGENE